MNILAETAIQACTFRNKDFTMPGSQLCAVSRFVDENS